ncbi:Isotrichodermin C-15 hydroxylase [Cytospora mali]|uniref:Isotrichodermin C-15 hydroxylase n=1 Tax=Cytospora mali TaxID=578113 RepID=A0A194W1K7_CYTMA|nr:Isotrichodermin C-15 hydroxylase [Valsa mali]
MAPTIEPSQLFNLRPAVGFPILLAVVFTVYSISSIIYNLFFSPLRKIPGPKLWAVTQIPYSHLMVSGKSHERMRELHEKYGDVVRVAPNQVAFIDPRAWKDTMGHRRAGQQENGRDPIFYALAKGGILAPIGSEEHGRQRRVLSHGFSAQSMMEQQPLIQQYVDLLMDRLRENAQGGSKALDMTKWYNWTTFDIIGDLAFGEPFGCLNEASYHPWVASLFEGVKQTVNLAVLRRSFPSVGRFFETHLLDLITPKREQHQNLTRLKVAKRMNMQVDRPDFIHSMLGKNVEGKEKLSLEQIQANASLLIVAGSETTATALAGATYLLCQNPDTLAKLTEEVRSSFSSEDEITLLSVQNLKYMLAVLDETLRLFPPVPTSTPRVVHEGGDVICDTFLPEKTVVNIWQYVMFRSPKNFALPDSFIPERWLGDPRFVDDKKEACQPFAFGPRNCVGKNLAYAEMRLILARVIWNFDMKLANNHERWIDNTEVYTIWDKKALNIYLSPRKIEK